ncbi:hypothetical protein H5410_053317, partial [Solanum commersonii]
KSGFASTLGVRSRRFHVILATIVLEQWTWVKLNCYDIGNSTTTTVISWSASMCECTRAKQCSYTLNYVDESRTTSYFVSDVLHLDTILRTSLIASSSASIIFGKLIMVYQSLTELIFLLWWWNLLLCPKKDEHGCDISLHGHECWVYFLSNSIVTEKCMIWMIFLLASYSQFSDSSDVMW